MRHVVIKFYASLLPIPCVGFHGASYKFYPNSSKLFFWHWINHLLRQILAKQPWMIWEHDSFESTTKTNNIITTPLYVVNTEYILTNNLHNPYVRFCVVNLCHYQSGRSPKVVALFLLQTSVAIWYDFFNCMIQSQWNQNIQESTIIIMI